MIKYRFDLVDSTLPGFREKDHIIPAQSLADAVQKFIRKHHLEAPAYWDEPFFDKTIDLTFKNENGNVKYRISW